MESKFNDNPFIVRLIELMRDFETAEFRGSAARDFYQTLCMAAATTGQQYGQNKMEYLGACERVWQFVAKVVEENTDSPGAANLN